MSIVYAGGTIVNTTLTCAAGSAEEVLNWIVSCLVTAGWAIVSGEGTTEVILDSAVTPQSLKARMRIAKTSTSACSCYLRSHVNNTEGSAVILASAASRVYNCIANRYQAFVWSGVANTVDTVMSVGQLWFPSLQTGVVNEASFMTGKYNADFRWLHWDQSAYYMQNGSLRTASQYTYTPESKQGGGGEYRIPPLLDGSYPGYAPLRCAQGGDVIGQYWDALFLCKVLLQGQTLTIDGRTFFALTNNHGLGTLMLAVS